jgi:hypothetical protein
MMRSMDLRVVKNTKLLMINKDSKITRKILLTSNKKIPLT